MTSAYAGLALHADVFIGGFLDRYTGIVRDYRDTFQRQHAGRDALYFEHHHYRRILAAITAIRLLNPGVVISLVGHSWGAATALRVVRGLARIGVDVDLVITVDPVCRKWKRTGVATRITRWINIDATPATSNGFRGDYWAALGGKWGDWPAGRADLHYGAPFHHNEFGALFEYAPPAGASALQWLCGEATIAAS